MARKTTTVHSCDRCGKKVDRPRDLRRFDLVVTKPFRESISFEVCDTCEAEFLGYVGDFTHVTVDPLVRD